MPMEVQSKMNIVRHAGRVPGRIRRVTSTRFPGVWHWGVEDWWPDVNGQPRMWHAQKGDVMRCTSYAEFSSGQLSEIVWTPQTYAERVSVILEGLPWNLSSANCEQVVRWAVEGRAYSVQLAIGER